MVQRIRRRAGRPRGLVLGIGDDCAIYRPSAEEDLLVTTDFVIEDVHFRRATHRAEDVGWKALARGLSDIAAMGGTPRFCLVSLAVAPWADERWIDGFYRGLLKLARRTRTELAGGDLAHAGKTVCDIVAAGWVPKGKALRRDGAKTGDAIYVSGVLGGSALGLATGRGRAWRRHLRPEPRLALGRILRQRFRPTAAMDISDGLLIDLHRLCLASKCAAELDGDVPVFAGAAIEQALHGGEDYELLFTLPAQVRRPRRISGVPITRIGSMCRGEAGSITIAGERRLPLGYDHFRKP